MTKAEDRSGIPLCRDRCLWTAFERPGLEPPAHSTGSRVCESMQIKLGISHVRDNRCAEENKARSGKIQYL